MDIIQPINEENILKLEIDGQEYLFKLSDQHDSEYLKKLATIVEKKIGENKRIFSISDYQKLLVLTCLNLAEDIFILNQKAQASNNASSNLNSNPDTSPQPSTQSQQLELIDRLEIIRDSLDPSNERENL